MGGVGKTELAIQYARRYEADYPGGVCWLSARESNLASQVVQFASEQMELSIPQQDFQGNPLSLTQQVSWCWRNWRPSEGLVLVVLDDVTELGICRELLPSGNRFRVLMTTRKRNLDSNIYEIPLHVLSPQEALQLLTVLVGETKVKRELETAKELCKYLGYLPLGLELVGRYITKKPPNWTIAKMLQRLKEQQLIKDEALNVEQQKLQKTLSTAQRGILAAFELSWLELEETAQNVAMLLGLFAPEIFLWEWVKSTVELLQWVSSNADTANEQLYERHLIQGIEDTDGNYKIKIHPLIREFLKYKLSASEQADDLKQAFVKTFIEIAREIPNSPTKENIKLVKDAIPHLAEVAQDLINIVSDEDLIWPFIGLGNFYRGQGLYALAASWYEQCLSVLESRLEKKHPLVATILNNLAELYQATGHYIEAEPLYKQALELYQRLLGEKHPLVATILNNLAGLYQATGRYIEAEPLYKQALELYQRLLGEKHSSVATILNNLAGLYQATGRYIEAEPLCQKALTLRKQILGEKHPDVASSLNNLAELYFDIGRYTEAEPLYEQALKLCKELLGEKHLDVATSLGNLAKLYKATGRYAEAEPLFNQALEICKELLGEKHPLVATSLNNLAELYRVIGCYTEAELLYQQAIELYRCILGDEHPDVATGLNNLASLYYVTKRYTEAKRLYEQALELKIFILGEEHPDVAFTLGNLAEIYRSLGHYNQAERLYEKVVELFKQTLGDEHPNIASTYNNLAVLYKSQQRYREAETMYVKAVGIAERSLGLEHFNTVTFRKNLELLRDLF